MTARLAQRLCRDRRGVAMVEFALCLPVLLLLATLGIEYANYVVTKKRISEIAAQIADNASRMGDATILTNKPVSEAEINDLFVGATMQAGSRIALQAQSRIILSSLEQNSSEGQWIHWQRCFGAKNYTSSYGKEDDGKTGTGFAGMGPASSRITAAKGTAVMFVEIAHTYRPLITILPLALNDIVEIATFNVRDSRDLSKVYSSPGVTPSACS